MPKRTVYLKRTVREVVLQMRMLPSSPAEARYSPFGEKESAVMAYIQMG